MTWQSLPYKEMELFMLTLVSGHLHSTYVSGGLYCYFSGAWRLSLGTHHISLVGRLSLGWFCGAEGLMAMARMSLGIGLRDRPAVSWHRRLALDWFHPSTLVYCHFFCTTFMAYQSCQSFALTLELPTYHRMMMFLLFLIIYLILRECRKSIVNQGSS